MDILEANFPQLLPQRHAVQRTRGADSSSIVGQRGVADDEASATVRVVRCDEIFLGSLMAHLHLAQLLICQAFDIKKVATHHRSNERTTNPFEYDDRVQLNEAITILSQIAPEIERLSSHPELFENESRKVEFLREAGRLALLCDEYLNIIKEEKNLKLSIEDELEAAALQRPLDLESRNRLAPWESFTGSLNVEKVPELPSFQRLQEEVPDMQLHKAHMLPPSAFLIAQHHKMKQDWCFSTVVDPPADVLALQHSTRQLVRDVLRKSDGSAVVKSLIAMAPAPDQLQGLAWGKQEQVAEMSRLMALLDDDVISVGVPPPGTFLGTFLSAEGMQLLRDHNEAARKGLEDCT
ncbi:hypothetical protein Slin15195_G039190 [Septoria linicola]|uniref:Uncharacterized protein n=1 Tax=Septoria linicola TaxID=215465 RepID=A0A9Q9AKB1_9PEZI|nr:hypothetical protein Slin14017_G120610 [Septoria linicola]USW50600.1 hypothetical protein Slin15195_G039190 [Septoria linicola]